MTEGHIRQCGRLRVCRHGGQSLGLSPRRLYSWASGPVSRCWLRRRAAKECALACCYFIHRPIEIEDE